MSLLIRIESQVMALVEAELQRLDKLREEMLAKAAGEVRQVRRGSVCVCKCRSREAGCRQRRVSLHVSLVLVTLRLRDSRRTDSQPVDGLRLALQPGASKSWALRLGSFVPPFFS